MANDIVSELNTKDTAERFNVFLANQGLGDMDPSSAARYRQGVEVSPMDELLALNGLSLDELFKKLLPEPPPLAVLEQSSVLESFDLSEQSLQILASLIEVPGSVTTESIQALVGALLQTLSSITNPDDLLRALVSLYSSAGDTPLFNGDDFTSAMIDLMKAVNTSASSSLLQALRVSPWILNQESTDLITGLSAPLGFTSALLKFDDVFNTDPITGTPQSETLVASRLGGTRLIGGGGRDLFVIPMNTTPLAETVTIADFDIFSGSKIVLDVRGYSKKLDVTIKSAKNSRIANRLAMKKSLFIFNAQTHELLLNENGKRRGFGQNGGSILSLENGSQLTSNELLFLRDDGLWQLDGTKFFG